MPSYEPFRCFYAINGFVANDMLCTALTSNKPAGAILMREAITIYKLDPMRFICAA
jgi:hypothetical protein